MYTRVAGPCMEDGGSPSVMTSPAFASQVIRQVVCNERRREINGREYVLCKSQLSGPFYYSNTCVGLRSSQKGTSRLKKAPRILVILFRPNSAEGRTLGAQKHSWWLHLHLTIASDATT
ncbi:uncharacterized protein RAG0_13925 [Rhynchosporium agropyri]|uniref:Uncharacterized protein n=1 Tax=Rhynchosporium agropyri TaxID=914238 RepID=A0A1E1LET6_9HELO|nr:uncharacterized protein RAG0_13925 [Rhynchosporium agropyri]